MSAYGVMYSSKYPSHRGANPYCPDHSTGVACPVGLGVAASSTSPISYAE